MRNMDVNWRPTQKTPGVDAAALLTGYMRIQISANLTELKYSQIRKDCGRTIDELLVRFRPQQTGSKPPRDKSFSKRKAVESHLAPLSPSSTNRRRV